MALRSNQSPTLRNPASQSWQNLGLVFVGCLILFVAMISVTQAQDSIPRRDYFSPGLELETGGRTGTCDVLTFTRDGEFLLAAGDDKVVRNWRCAKKQLFTSGLPTLRWKSWREARGQIHALAFSPTPDQRYVAIGGLGMKPSQLAVIDRFTGRIKHGLWETTQAGGVWSMAFAPNGRQIAFGNDDGGVRVWDLTGKRNETARLIGQHAPKKIAKLRQVVLTTYLNQNQVLSVASDGSVLVSDTAAQTISTKPLFQFDTLGGKVWRAVLGSNNDEKWLAVALQETVAKNGQQNRVQVIIRSLRAGQVPKTIFLPFDHYPQCLAVDETGDRLAIGIRRLDLEQNEATAFFRELAPHVAIFSLKGNQPKQVAKIPYDYRVDAVAFHPKENLLAVAGGADHDVTLWDLNNIQEPTTTIQGVGTSLWEVAFSKADSAIIGFKRKRLELPPHPNRRGDGPWEVFHLKDRLWLTRDNPPAQRKGNQNPAAKKRNGIPPRLKNGNNNARLPVAQFVGRPANKKKPIDKPFTPVKTIPTWKGWRVVTFNPKKPQSNQWWVQSPTKKKWPLELERGRFDDPRCYTFLPPSRANPTVPRLAVGHYYGVSVFELQPLGPRRVRLMVGHSGPVVSLGVSSDSKIMVTSSRDQTICGWSLEPWPSHPELGARFLPQKDSLLVLDLDAGSPAWEVGLSKGDEIIFLASTARRPPVRFNNAKRKLPKFVIASEPWFPKIGNPNAALAEVRDPVPAQQLFFGWRRKNEQNLFWAGTSVFQRPIWRFFPTRSGEWVLWRWRDHYYDASTRGDQFLGFAKFGQTIFETPEFFPVEQFRNLLQDNSKLLQLHNPEKLKKLFTGTFRRVPDIAPPKNVFIEPIAKGKVTKNGTIYEVGEKGLAMKLNAEFRGPRGFGKLKRAILWINDFKYKEWPNKQQPKFNPNKFQEEISIPQNLLRQGMNDILLQCYNQGNVREESSRIKVMSKNQQRRKPVLYGVVAGVGQYRRLPKIQKLPAPKQPPLARLAQGLVQLPDLKANEDADAFYWMLTELPPKMFQRVQIADPLLDQKATRKNVIDNLEKLEGKVTPDDILIFYLGGHGIQASALVMEVEKQQEELKNAKKRNVLLANKLGNLRGTFVKQGLESLEGFYFCCSNFDPLQFAQTTIDFAELYEKLTKLPCHKVIFVDTCFSGGYAKRIRQSRLKHDPIRNLTLDGVGPIIFVGCQPDESVYEHDAIDAYMQSVFAAAVRTTIQEPSGFAKADVNKNQTLEPKELFQGIRYQVQKKLEFLRRASGRGPRRQEIKQTPDYFVPDIEAELSLFPKPQ
ncbi:MAG: hypothetical protein ACFCD0_15025 [Gemmataceae bacterium]